MFRLIVLLPVFILTAAACATSSSGEAPTAVVSVPLTTSAAGAAALVSGPLNPETCEGVLGSPPSTHTLGLQSLTGIAQQESSQINAMCSAVYETSNPGDPFLTIALIKFDSDTPSIERYDLLKSTFVTIGHPISEINNADADHIDRFSALIDRDGIGRTTVLRQNNWALTVSVGPTTQDSLWTSDDLQVIGESILERVRQ